MQISSLPIEHELKYGTARSHAQLPDLMHNSSGLGIFGADRSFLEKKGFGLVHGDSGTIRVNAFNSLLVGTEPR